jgi:hypothetical protein
MKLQAMSTVALDWPLFWSLQVTLYGSVQFSPLPDKEGIVAGHRHSNTGTSAGSCEESV